MALYTDILQYGTGSHTTSSESANAIATDILTDGVVGSVGSSGGVAPMTGAFAVNAQGTPDTTVAVTAGVVYVTGTPTSQGSQRLRVKMTANENITISANASGSTRYDWIYIKLDPTNMANPNTAADNVATLVTSRSTSSSVDNGTPPAYGLVIAKVTVANGFSTITNGNIADARVQTGTTPGNASVTNNAIITNAVTADKLATSAITLGYAQITSSFNTASTTATQVTGLTASVTIPAGGRRIKITVYSVMFNNASNTPVVVVYDGVVASGTQVGQWNGTVVYGGGICMQAIVNPSAGAKTYNVGVYAAGGTTTLLASSAAPAFILVEAI